MRSSLHSITQRFNKAAKDYDKAAFLQAEVAQHLVDWAMPQASPAEILDIGSGTGLVSAAITKRWPGASITALDSAPAMLRQAQQKMPTLTVITGDAGQLDLPVRFDAIFCSMLLHWLPDPLKALQLWRGWLKPGGSLYVALLAEGSFREWSGLCMEQGLHDGLWVMPSPDFAKHIALRTERRRIPVIHPSAMAFLRQLKATGASMPRAGYRPLDASSMRRILAHAQTPFTISYETLYIELPSSPKI